MFEAAKLAHSPDDAEPTEPNGFETPPHVIPYQGSKRLLGPMIASLFDADDETLYEPFAGSAAISNVA